MASNVPSLTSSPAYRAGSFALFVAVAAILIALAFEHLGGFAPCPLCLEQRWAYYAGIPLLLLALAMASAGRSKAAALLFFLIAIGFLANAGLGVYHAGAEWKFWPGPDTCAGALQPLKPVAGDLLKQLPTTRVVRCDEAAGRFFGLSFAGWNVVASMVAFAASLQAAFAAQNPRD